MEGRGDKELVDRLLAGDEAAFEAFFADFFPRLYRFALARVGMDEDAAEEVAQTTLVRVFQKLGTYRGEAALFTWVCTFCRHEISAYFRGRGRRPDPAPLAEDLPEVRQALDSLAAEDDPESSAGRGELSRLVRVTLDHLPAHYAEVLEWKYLLGLSVAEIAARLGLGLKATESRLTRARGAFRDGFAALTGSSFSPHVR